MLGDQLRRRMADKQISQKARRSFSSSRVGLWIFNSGYVDVAKTIADVFNEAFEPEVKKELPPEMVTRRKGHDFGFGDYVN